MEQRVLGRTGDRFGHRTRHVAARRGLGKRVRDRRDGVLQAAVESGVTFFDTADVYGDGRSERIIGRFVAGNAGQGVTVATKMGRRVEQSEEHYTLENFRAWTDRSRVNLGTDRLDLVQLHCPPTAVFSSDAVFDALDTLVAEERIAAYGVSVETCDAGAGRDRAPGHGQRADHPERVPAQAARSGAARRGRGGGRHHRPGAARVRAALRPVHQGHHVRRRRPPQLQRPRRGVRRRGDVLRRGLRGRVDAAAEFTAITGAVPGRGPRLSGHCGG